MNGFGNGYPFRSNNIIDHRHDIPNNPNETNTGPNAQRSDHSHENPNWVDNTYGWNFLESDFMDSCFSLSDSDSSPPEEEMFIFDHFEINLTQTSSVQNAGLNSSCSFMPGFSNPDELNMFLNRTFSCDNKKIPIKEKIIIFNFICRRHMESSSNQIPIRKLTRRDQRLRSRLDKRLIEIGHLIKKFFSSREEIGNCYQLIHQSRMRRR